MHLFTDLLFVFSINRLSYTTSGKCENAHHNILEHKMFLSNKRFIYDVTPNISPSMEAIPKLLSSLKTLNSISVPALIQSCLYGRVQAYFHSPVPRTTTPTFLGENKCWCQIEKQEKASSCPQRGWK